MKVIFSFLGFMANEQGVGVADVAKSGGQLWWWLCHNDDGGGNCGYEQ